MLQQVGPQQIPILHAVRRAVPPSPQAADPGLDLANCCGSGRRRMAGKCSRAGPTTHPGAGERQRPRRSDRGAGCSKTPAATRILVAHQSS